MFAGGVDATIQPPNWEEKARVGKRASRLNLMVVRWGSEHCEGAELVSAYVELSSCVWTYIGLKRLLGLPPRVPTGTVRTDTDTLRTRALGSRVPTKGNAEEYLQTLRRYESANPLIGTTGNNTAKLTCS